MGEASAITNEELAIENNKLLMQGAMQCFSTCIYTQIVCQMLHKRGGLICSSLPGSRGNWKRAQSCSYLNNFFASFIILKFNGLTAAIAISQTED